MVTDADLAKKITDMLNAAATAVSAPFKFQIYPNMGDFQAAIESPTRSELPTPIINGTLTCTSSQIVPLQNVKSYTVTQLLNIVAPSSPKCPQEGIEEVMAAIRYFVEANAGLAQSIKDEDGNTYASVFAPQLPSVGQLSQDIGFWYIPVTLFLSWQFIEGGVISNEIGLTINGTPAIITSGAAKRTRIAQTAPRGTNAETGTTSTDSEEMETVIGQQGLTIQAVVPYTTDGVGATLVADLFLGTLDTTYTVEYSDGVVKTAAGENPSWLMVATEISLSIVAGTVASVNVTLVVAASDVYGTTEG